MKTIVLSPKPINGRSRRIGDIYFEPELRGLYVYLGDDHENQVRVVLPLKDFEEAQKYFCAKMGPVGYLEESDLMMRIFRKFFV